MCRTNILGGDVKKWVQVKCVKIPKSLPIVCSAPFCDWGVVVLIHAMDSAQTAQCVLYSVVVGVLLLIAGFVIFILHLYVLGPAFDEVEPRRLEHNATTDVSDGVHDYDYE